MELSSEEKERLRASEESFAPRRKEHMKVFAAAMSSPASRRRTSFLKIAPQPPGLPSQKKLPARFTRTIVPLSARQRSVSASLSPRDEAGFRSGNLSATGATGQEGGVRPLTSPSQSRRQRPQQQQQGQHQRERPTTQVGRKRAPSRPGSYAAGALQRQRTGGGKTRPQTGSAIPTRPKTKQGNRTRNRPATVSTLTREGAVS